MLEMVVTANNMTRIAITTMLLMTKTSAMAVMVVSLEALVVVVVGNGTDCRRQQPNAGGG